MSGCLSAIRTLMCVLHRAAVWPRRRYAHRFARGGFAERQFEVVLGLRDVAGIACRVVVDGAVRLQLAPGVSASGDDLTADVYTFAGN